METIDLGNGTKCEIYDNGDKYWYLHGKYHRTDGPAIEYVNAYKAWYFHGERHRTDGPAVEYASGYKAWYYEGEKIICQSTQEFQRLINLKIFW
jgi:hypothetical protein